MTNEQAREILQGAIKKPNTKDGYLGQAIDMAIKALEQNTVSQETYDSEYLARKQAEQKLYEIEQNTSNDCVSRQAVKEGMRKYGFHSPDMTVTEFIEDELTSVTPTQSWILIKRRDLTQEEKELYSSFYGFEPEYMIESRMPDDGEEVLVSAGGIVFKDNFSRDDFDFENISVDEIDAWMPLPQPYEEKRGNKYGGN